MVCFVTLKHYRSSKIVQYVPYYVCNTPYSGLIVRGVYRSREQRQLARQIADVYALLRDLVREHFRGPLPSIDTGKY